MSITKEQIEKILEDNNVVIQSSTGLENQATEARNKLDGIILTNERIMKNIANRKKRAQLKVEMLKVSATRTDEARVDEARADEARVRADEARAKAAETHKELMNTFTEIRLLSKSRK